MANRKPNTQSLTSPNIDKGLLNKYSLPGDVQADLQDAFNFYDKEGCGTISMVHFRNILHNFGFHRLSKKEIDDDLKKAASNFLQCQVVEFDDCKYVVARRWMNSGNTDEARECFRLFDKKERNEITAADLKQVLSNYLEFPVSENDIQDFIGECGGHLDGSGKISSKRFCELYLS